MPSVVMTICISAAAKNARAKSRRLARLRRRLAAARNRAKQARTRRRLAPVEERGQWKPLVLEAFLPKRSRICAVSW